MNAFNNNVAIDEEEGEMKLNNLQTNNENNENKEK